MVCLSQVVLTLVVAVTANPSFYHNHYHSWELSAKTISPDGFHRHAALVNGVFPGPVLTAQKGDHITVDVHNDLWDPTMRRSTSIHWHGIFQPHNAFNDGPSFVTQCPISPGHSYPYNLALGEQAGTFWYHSHLSTQYVDGLRGPLIIYDPHDPQKYLYDVDDESTIISLADWYHPTALNATDAFNAGGDEPVPSSGLVNGAGRFSGGPIVPWSRINVEAGKRYRLRLISISAAAQFEFSIAQHSMTVIEADGVAHKPYKVDSLPILAGQRYSVVITANQPIANYWISSPMFIRGATTSPANPEFNGSNVFAVLHYHKAPNADPIVAPPIGLSPGGIEFQEYKLQPLVQTGVPGGNRPADQTFNFTFAPNFSHVPVNGDAWIINDQSYTPPSVPTLLNILANGHTTPSQFAPSENTLIIKRNAVIDVFLNGTAGHPFHLHGHTFDVIQSASGGPPNFVNPPRRDVVATGDSPVQIRFKTDNPGPWMFHCHIEWHFQGGLAVVFVENPDGIKETVHPNREWEELCKIYNKLPKELQ